VAVRPDSEAKEIELKLAFEQADVERIRAHPLLVVAGEVKVRELISIYYDTPDDVLRANDVFLRIRATGDGYVQTIKTAGGKTELLERGEWEHVLETPEPDLENVAETPLEPLLSEDLRTGLQPRFHTRFRREAYSIVQHGAEIELAIDLGEITAGSKAALISEVELELKSGERDVLFVLARELAKTLPLTLAIKTKAERGFQLLDGGDYEVEKAGAIIVTPDMTCAEAFRAIARNCLRQVIANVPGVRNGRPEALHQMRVGLRRFRAALGLFSEVVADEERESGKSGLKWLGGELGSARDLDVLTADVLAPEDGAHHGHPEVESLYRDLMEKRAAAYSQVHETLHTDRFRTLLIDVAAWIERGAWSANALAAESISPYAKRQLARIRRKIKKEGKNLDKLSTEARHQVCIRAKRLRYATEFFAATFDGKTGLKRRRNSLAALEELQDALGAFNDLAMRQRTLESGGSLSIAAIVPPGDEKKLLKQAVDAYERFANVRPFWKG